MSGWNFADVYEAVAAAVPQRRCQLQGERSHSWADFDRRANGLAADLLAAGLGSQSKVVAYLHNGPEYLETYIGAFKAGLVPVNTNYRYGRDEISYLFDNADAEAVVFHSSFTELVESVRPHLPRVRRWYWVNDETSAAGASAAGAPAADAPPWAVDYAAVVAAGTAEAVRPPWGRTGDDLLLLYTGGTTGMPKGVMWRQDDLFNVLGAGGNAILGIPPATSIDELASRLDPAVPGLALLAACPLMHGTGQFSSLIAMNMGGCVATLPSRHFDPAELLSEVQRHRINSVIIVGQAFAGPILEHLDASPGAYDLSSVLMMSSSGVMWSQENKEGLLRHMPQAALFDSFGSSEAVGMGASVSTAAGAAQTAKFQLGPACAVFTDNGRRVQPGSGERGMVAVGGHIPLGYYKDEAKSAQTFRTFEGTRWSVPGDWAEVQADGTLVLLGRGSVCINTGGEKVFPEEVEEALKRHAGVRDAVAVGIPDTRFGEAICAVVEASGPHAPTLDDLAGTVRDHLAPFKAPRHLVLVDSIGRAPNGKVDYKRLRAVALEQLGPAT